MSNASSKRIRRLSDAAKIQWAKFDAQSGDMLSLQQHLKDAFEVARYLWDEWLSESLKRVLAREFGSEKAARSWVTFYAGIHDVGKASYPFQAKVSELFDRSAAYGLDAVTAPSSEQLRQAPHGSVGANSFFYWLLDNFGFDADAAVTFVSPLGGHHGKFPSQSQLGSCEQFASVYENEEWEALRCEFFDFMRETAGLSEDDFEGLGVSGLPAPVQMLLTGIVVMADWIASNVNLFPLSIAEEVSGSRSSDAIDYLDLPDPWEPKKDVKPEDLFTARFSLPSGASPYPVQLDAVRLAKDANEPGLFLIEAPTGEGKTEAALAVAEVLASKFGCGGVQVALPTCATSDAMFSRVLEWLKRAISDDQLASAMLTHSRAQFNEEFQGLKFPSTGLANIYDEDFSTASTEPAVEAHWWLQSRKTAALADFIVGTIDQFLFAALQSKHVMLRHLGLAGKVLVLDEIHAADVYMRQYLYRALQWCGAYRVPVIALSATLPPTIRYQLMESYLQGSCEFQRRSSLPAEIEQKMAEAREDCAYPLLTYFSPHDVVICHPKQSSRSQRTALDYCDESEIRTVLERELASGGCAVVVCNTVRRAQSFYDEILTSKVFDSEEVFLLHSRFIAADRQRKEKQLVAKYGKHGRRPKRGIVVSTQIVEQSLDLDFDLMLSDFAPIDLLIQRVGRLHRHERNDRPRHLAEPRLVLFGVTEPAMSNPPVFAAGSERIYSKSLLLRTAAVLVGKTTIDSPSDVANLVRNVYDALALSPEMWQNEWDTAEAELMQAEEKLASKASRSLGPTPHEQDMSKWFVLESGEEYKGQSQVRDIEESIEVVLVENHDAKIYSLPWLENRGGESLDDTNGVDDELAREVAKCTISIPFWQVGDIDHFIAELERFGNPTWQQSSWLKGLLPMPLNLEGKFQFDDITFIYNTKYGLSVVREQESK